MTVPEKLEMLKNILTSEADNLPSAELLNTYLSISGQEIIHWLYSYKGKIPDDAKVPAQYEMTQIMACVAGLTIAGAEGQTGHGENGISRSFKYDNMIAFVRAHVVPFVGVM